jgi:hypothetical protein
MREASRLLGDNPMTLEEEAARLNTLLAGKVVKRAQRYRPKEFVIEFTEGTRLSVDWQQN